MKEIRTYSPEDNQEYRAYEEEGKKFIEGYASRYNVRSKLLPTKTKSFYEIIESGAFRDVLMANPDVIANINHDRGKLMARTKSGTLHLSEDEYGLKYRFEVPPVSYANDVYELIKRGDMFESSFAFNIDSKDQSFSKLEDGTPLRTISKIQNLYDIAVVTDGAYPNTDVVARSLDDDISKIEEIQPEIENKEVEENESKRKLNNDFITRILLKRNFSRHKQNQI